MPRHIGNQTEIGAVEFVFLDVETTGLDPGKGDRICEVALLRVRRSEDEEEIETLVNPQRPIPPDVQELNGITDAMVSGAPAFSEIAATVLRLLEGAVIVAHNAQFDLNFLNDELQRAASRTLENPRIDTLNLVRNFYRLPGYSLGSVAASLKIPFERLHRAMADVRLTREIFRRFLTDFAALEIRTLGDLLELQEDRQAEWMERAGIFEEKIRSAIASEKTVWMKYLTGGGLASEREARPIALESKGPYVYLRAHCFLTREERSFRLDRIIELKILP